MFSSSSAVGFFLGEGAFYFGISDDPPSFFGLIGTFYTLGFAIGFFTTLEGAGNLG